MNPAIIQATVQKIYILITTSLIATTSSIVGAVVVGSHFAVPFASEVIHNILTPEMGETIKIATKNGHKILFGIIPSGSVMLGIYESVKLRMILTNSIVPLSGSLFLLYKSFKISQYFVELEFEKLGREEFKILYNFIQAWSIDEKLTLEDVLQKVIARQRNFLRQGIDGWEHPIEQHPRFVILASLNGYLKDLAARQSRVLSEISNKDLDNTVFLNFLKLIESRALGDWSSFIQKREELLPGLSFWLPRAYIVESNFSECSNFLQGDETKVVIDDESIVFVHSTDQIERMRLEIDEIAQTNFSSLSNNLSTSFDSLIESGLQFHI